MSDIERDSEAKAYLVGGGIASLAAAAFLIRDAGMLGRNITVFEELAVLGGSLDGAGTAADGYVIRGGRMFESKYLCTYDLFASIPTLDGSKTVTEEIFAFSELIPTNSDSRLVRDGRRIEAPEFRLSEGHILTLERLAIEPEWMLGKSSIADQFDPSFFTTNFWLMWCTTFAFQPWHSAVEFKRYLVRFTHMVAGFNRLNGVMRTVYNQYDSLVRPLQKWLDERGVRFELGTRVTGVEFEERDGRTRAARISFERSLGAEQPESVERSGGAQTIALGANDYAIVTLGSMTESSSLGSSDAPAALKGKRDGGAWTLWEQIAAGRPEFGNPSAFDGHIDESKWVSFTATLREPTFLRLVRDFTGNVPGEGALVTFADSNWLASIVVPRQPHFANQPPDVEVCWGYGLFVDKPGNFVGKPMSQCTGHEMLREVLGHLRIEAEAAQILATSTVIPCMMPFITSQFLRREKGDRPDVVPKGAENFAFTGQYCELTDDVVFTVEYSVRSAYAAVSTLFDTGRKPPPVYKGQYDPRVLVQAFETLHGFKR